MKITQRCLTFATNPWNPMYPNAPFRVYWVGGRVVKNICSNGMLEQRTVSITPTWITPSSVPSAKCHEHFLWVLNIITTRFAQEPIDALRLQFQMAKSRNWFS